MHTSHFLPAHTRTKTCNSKLNRWFEVLHAPFLPLMHNAHRKQTANAHPFSSGYHMFAHTRYKHHDLQTEKHRNEKEKTRRGSRTLVYTLPGTSFNRRTKHKLSSLRRTKHRLSNLRRTKRRLSSLRRTKYTLSSLPRCLTRITNIQQHSRGSGNGKHVMLLPRVYIRYFRYHSQEGGHHEQIFV